MAARILFLLLALLRVVHSAHGEAPAWDSALIKLERWPANAPAAHVSAAFPVAADLLATILINPGLTDNYRAVTPAGIRPVRLLARDDASGFSLLTGAGDSQKDWTAVPLPDTFPALLPGAILTLQSATPADARFAGREILHQSRLLDCPWLRVHLPRGTWSPGTPVTGPGGSLAGMLAGEVPGVTEAGRVLPAAAVRHFVKLWTERQTLATAKLGLRLSPGSGIPRVEQCVAALPAERAGLHPGDIILRIGTTAVSDAAAAAEACFYLRVDEPVTVAVLRGTETLHLTMRPVSATPAKPEPDKP